MDIKEIKTDLHIKSLRLRIKDHKKQIDNLKNPEYTQGIIDQMIQEHINELKSLEKQLGYRVRKLKKQHERKINPPTCPVRKDSMRVGQQTATISKKRNVIEVHLECKKAAETLLDS